MINKNDCINRKIKITEDLKDRMSKNKKEWLFKMSNKIEDLKDKIKMIKENLEDLMINNSKKDIS